MNNSTVNVILQISMLAGLFMVAYLLFMPVLAGVFFNSAKPSESRSVIEINSSRNDTQRMVVTRARNLRQRNPRALIEVVALGDGISLVTQNSPHQQTIQSLINQGIIFTACQHSLKRKGENSLLPVELLPGIKLVEDGHRYAEQLKDAGYIDELA